MTLIEQIFTDYQEIIGYLSDLCYQCSNLVTIRMNFNQPIPDILSENTYQSEN